MDIAPWPQWYRPDTDAMARATGNISNNTTIDPPMKATANGGTVISCVRINVYPKPCTIEGVKLVILSWGRDSY
jgi:hypothetical protein